MDQMVKRLLVTLLAFVALGLTMVSPVAAQDTDACSHEPTVAALHACVTHAAAHGHIDNAGVARALHAQLEAADIAIATGNNVAAVGALNAFVNTLAAQSGKHVDELVATHLSSHVAPIVGALQG